MTFRGSKIQSGQLFHRRAFSPQLLTTITYVTKMSATLTEPPTSTAAKPHKEEPLVFDHHFHKVSFWGVNRHETTKMPVAYHDDRSQYPAWTWTGRITVRDKNCQRELQIGFMTDVFYQEMIADLTFREIIFLILRGNRLHKLDLSLREEEILIERIAFKALSHYAFYSGPRTHLEKSFHLQPFRIGTSGNDDHNLEYHVAFENASELAGGWGKPIST